MVQVGMSNMYIDMGVNRGSEKGTGKKHCGEKNTACGYHYQHSRLQES